MFSCSSISRDPRIEVETEQRGDVARSTLDAADYLIKQNDPERLDRWLAKHSAVECAAILRHIEAKGFAR